MQQIKNKLYLHLIFKNLIIDIDETNFKYPFRRSHPNGLQ
jgi:hypothetical protein